MKIPGLDSSIIINDKAMPVFLKGGDKAVIIYHGYLGSPDDVFCLAKEYNRRGYTVFVPRLPGHGTSGNDFMSVSGRDWLRKAFDTYTEINGRYKKIILAGFSMGGLLAIIAASVFSPDALVLIAPAVTNKRRVKIHLAPFMMLFAKKIKRKKKEEVKNAFEDYLRKEYWMFDWPAAAYSILRMQKEALNRLKLIKCRTFILLSESDRTVPVKAGRLISTRIKPELLTIQKLKCSKHVIFKGAEKDFAAKSIADWTDSVLSENR